MFSEDEVICVKCPTCGSELGDLADEYYCYNCGRSVSKDNAECGKSITFDDNHDYGEHDYDSMVNNGDEICLNCTYWSVSPYGRAHGMYCRRGNGQTEPEQIGLIKSDLYENELSSRTSGCSRAVS